MDKIPAIKLTPEQARHFAVGKRAWTHHGWSQTHDGMIEAIFQEVVPHLRGKGIKAVNFLTISIDPEGVGAISMYDDGKKEWVTKEIFAPVDPDEELMWDEEE